MPAITGSWTSLPEVDFNVAHPGGGFLHFRDQFSDPEHTQLITYRDPMTGQDTGGNVRTIIEAQAVQFGWPLVGIYISGSGSAPHCAIPRSDFPSQTGSPEIRAEKLQNDIDAALEGIYKSEQVIDDPTDPDFGQTVNIRNFWVNAHIFNYKQGGDYDPSVPDYLFRVGNSTPRPSWWQRFG